MNILDVATIPARRTPLPDGSTVPTLLGSNIGPPAAVLHATLPTAAACPSTTTDPPTSC